VNFAYFDLDNPFSLKPADKRVPFDTYSNLDAYLASGSQAAGFAVGTQDAAAALDLLRRLRGRPESSIKPIFLMTSLGQKVDEICDGVVDSIEEAYNLTRDIDQRLRKIDPVLFTESENIIFRLLGYLYARPNAAFSPSRHWSNPKLYNFPVFEAIVGPEENPGLWLKNLVDRSLLVKTLLIDRVRLCPKCEWAHLNFIDNCPNCSSIDITQKPFLHCFTCGHVNSEENFIAKGLLSCPNCNTRLRHIGADYDRALENYTCNDCGHIFGEPEVLADCQHCNAKSRPQDLIPETMHRVEITDHGIAAVKSGLLDDVYALLDTLNNINPAHFESLLDWMLNLVQRYTDDLFSLIGIRFQNVLELTETIGRRRVTELMDGFVGRIREIVRSTDLTTRTSQQNFWILLPKTDRTGSEIVHNRIMGIEPDSKQPEGIGIEINSVSFSTPQDLQAGESARLLLARLEGGLH